MDYKNINIQRIEKEFNKQITEGYHRTASLSISAQNKIIYEINSTPRTIKKPLFPIMSISKPLAAAVLWRYYAKGFFEWDDPIIKFWPEYGNNGKDRTSIKNILTHTAGVPNHESLPLRDYADWGRIIEWIEGLVPEYPPGQMIQYHALTFGWIVAELASRISGLSFEHSFIREVSEPLNLNDTNFIIPLSQQKRLLPLNVSDDFEDPLLPKNMSAIHKNLVIMPAGSAVSTSNDICKFFSIIANKGKYKHNSWLPQEIISEITTTKAEGLEHSGYYYKLGLGLMLNSGINNKFGAPQHCQTVGHGGLGISSAWADLDCGIAMAYITTTCQPEEMKDHLHRTMSSVVRSSVEYE